MRQMLVYLPVAILVLGIFFGVLQMWRVLMFLIFWVASCVGLAVLMVMDVVHVDFFLGTLIVITLMLPSFLFATLFSLATSKQVTPAPAHIVAEGMVIGAKKAHGVYQNLDPEDKKLLHGIARKGVAVGAAYLFGRVR